MVPPNISLFRRPYILPSASTMSSMDSLPDSLLVQILSRLDDSADVARCRVASKAFDHIFPYLRSINLVSTSKWYNSSKSRVSNSSSTNIKPFKEVFLHLISKQEIVESVSIRINHSIFHRVNPENDSDDLYLTELDFIKEWLPRVSESLKSLSIPATSYNNRRRSNVLPLISVYCHNLVNLKLSSTRLSMDNMNPMPMLTNLTLAFTELEDEHLNQLNICFPNLKFLDLMSVIGLVDPKIHHLNLQTFHFAALNNAPSLTLITPNLITLRIESLKHTTLHVEAPMLSHFHLGVIHAGALNFKTFENMKTLWLESRYLNSLLSEFPVIETLENLTLDSRYQAPKDTEDSNLNLQKVFMVFPNVCHLCIKLRAWSEFKACFNPEGCETLDGWKRLNTIRLYLPVVDPLLTFSSVARVLDQCVGLSTVSLLINTHALGSEHKNFMSKCMARWPGLKWRWGTWNEDMEDIWITDIETP